MLKRYLIISTIIFIIFELLFMTGVLSRGLVFPSNWTMLELILCLPYSITIITSFIFTFAITPFNTHLALFHIFMIALNAYFLFKTRSNRTYEKPLEK